jgi:hypothetical protein
MGEATVVTVTTLTEVLSMGTTTTMETKLAAITVSLNESLALLASSAQRLRVKEKEEQVATMALSSTTTMLRFMQDGVQEKLQTKRLLSFPIFAHQVRAVGALHVDAVFPSAMPTRYSTKSLGHYSDRDHDVPVFHTSDTTPLQAGASCGTGSCRLQGRGVAGMNTPAGCSAHV